VSLLAGLLLLLAPKVPSLIANLASNPAYTPVADDPSVTFSNPLGNLLANPSGANSNPLPSTGVTGLNVSAHSFQDGLLHFDTATATITGKTPDTGLLAPSGAQSVTIFTIENVSTQSVIQPSLSEPNGK
jgi:hypothetical protein